MKLKKAHEPVEEPLKAGELESFMLNEANEVVAAFKKRRADENVRLRDATDSEHWCALCFQTREQKEEFLAKVKWDGIGDKYLDGIKCAKALGIALDTPVPPSRKIVRFGGEYTKRIIK